MHFYAVLFTVYCLWPLWCAPGSPHAFLSSRNHPQPPHPFSYPSLKIQLLRRVLTCFQPLSTALKSYDMLTHVYDLSQLYPRSPAHFRAHTLISDPPPYLNSISFVTTCFHVFPTSVNCLQTPKRVANHPHAFLRQSAPFFFTYFSSIFIIFDHFHLFFIVFTHFFYHILVLLCTSTLPQPCSRPSTHFWSLPPIFAHFRVFSIFFHTFINFYSFITFFYVFLITDNFRVLVIARYECRLELWLCQVKSTWPNRVVCQRSNDASPSWWLTSFVSCFHVWAPLLFPAASRRPLCFFFDPPSTPFSPARYLGV